MKRLIGLIAVILITATSASGLVNTNAVNITVGDTAGHNYKQFDFTWSGFDDQYLHFVLDRSIADHTWTFKLTKDTITGQVAYVSTTATRSTSNITLSVSRANVPPNASYKASLRGVSDADGYGIDVARGKVSVTDSLFDDADGTYIFPASLDSDAVVLSAGDGMTGGLTNTTAQGFVGNGGNLTNVTSTGVSAASLTEAMLKAVDTASDEDFLTYETTTGDFEWVSIGELDHGSIGSLGDNDHTQYRLKTTDHTHATTGAQAGTIDHGDLDGRGDDDHSTYGNLGGVETISGNWVNTANPWADNEVVDTLTASNYVLKSGDTMTGNLVMSTAQAIGISSGGEIEFTNDTLDLIKMLVANVRVGDGAPSNATAAEELYVEGDIESGAGVYLNSATPSLYFVDSTGSEEDWQIISGAQTINGTSEDGLHFIDSGDARVDASITDTDGNFHLGIGHVVANRQVVVLAAGHTNTVAESKGSFITQSTANTIQLVDSGRVTGMQVTILVTANVVVPIIDGDGDAAADLIWKDGSDGDAITNSGSAGECITLIFDGTKWRAIHIEGSWVLSG